MRKLLIPLLAALALPTAVSAGFKSQWEAGRACKNWQQKGGTYELYLQSQSRYQTFYIRTCSDEVSTRQFIGFIEKKYKRNRTYYTEKKYNLFDPRPVKYFRY